MNYGVTDLNLSARPFQCPEWKIQGRMFYFTDYLISRSHFDVLILIGNSLSFSREFCGERHVKSWSASGAFKYFCK